MKSLKITTALFIAMLGGTAVLHSQNRGSLIVNEVSNGDSLSREWIEFIAVPSGGDGAATVDITGTIIDDHSGIYTGGPQSGTGISQGHLRLRDIPLFQNFPAGYLLVIYNARDIDQSAPVNTLQIAFNNRTLTGANTGVTLGSAFAQLGDSAIFVAVGRDSVIERNAAVPVFNSDLYCTGEYVTGDTLSWNSIGLNNSLDAVEVLCAGCFTEEDVTIGEPKIFHAFGYDDTLNLYSHYTNPVSGFLDGALYQFSADTLSADTLKGSRRAFQFFQGSDPGADINWRAVPQASGTPGSYNTPLNALYAEEIILGLGNYASCSDNFDTIPGGTVARGNAVLVVTEYSNGSSGGNCEYVELYVGFKGTVKPAGSADITGWIVDDNAGTFSNCVSGRGIGAGHLRFADVGTWKNVPYGSVIVLYNSAENCNSFVSDEDSTGRKYFIAVGNTSVMEYDQSVPSFASCDYCTASYSAPGSWNAITLTNGGDGIQVRCPNMCPDEPPFYHGSCFGSSMSGIAPVTGVHLGALDLGSASGSVKTYEFYQMSSITTLANWRTTAYTFASTALTAGFVPAAFSTAAMAGTLDFPGCGVISPRMPLIDENAENDAPANDLLAVYPNPSNDVVNFELIASNGAVIQVMDMTGRVIRTIPVQASESTLQRVSIDVTSMNGGVYVYTINGEGISFKGKMIVNK